jgi:protein-S-isoprenylcysteine O-methyltransferase Ste14
MIGSVIMIAADAQKFFTLKNRSGLIDNGMHRYIRHPNYLGEMLIYASFALMVWHWLPVLVLTWVWIGLFAVNMMIKEASLSRYPQWKEYKKRSKWLLPGIF